MALGRVYSIMDLLVSTQTAKNYQESALAATLFLLNQVMLLALAAGSAAATVNVHLWKLAELQRQADRQFSLWAIDKDCLGGAVPPLGQWLVVADGGWCV